jgi:hypothetical protein
MHDGNSPCSQGPVTESKLFNGGKVTLPPVAVVPVAVEALVLGSFRESGFNPEQPPHLSSPPIRLSVLRISHTHDHSEKSVNLAR